MTVSHKYLQPGMGTSERKAPVSNPGSKPMNSKKFHMYPNSMPQSARVQQTCTGGIYCRAYYETVTKGNVSHGDTSYTLNYKGFSASAQPVRLDWWVLLRKQSAQPNQVY